MLMCLLSEERLFARGLFRFSRFCVALGLFLAAAALFSSWTEPARAQTTATYTVTFEGNWNTDSTPGGVISGAHFTTLIGAVHNSSVTFWRVGGRATTGVERVAEFGTTPPFEGEIRSAGSDVKSLVSQSGTSATGTRTFEVEFSRSHPLFTLLSMIGPSPDWFVGVSGLSMLNGSDAWRSSHTVDLFAYDAGTEDGENFSLNNPDTVPKGTITSLRNKEKFSDVRMARLTFTLKTPPQNNAPEFSGMNTARSFAETVGSATVQTAGNVGAAVTATDQDGDTLTYRLEGTDAGKFSIVSGSGQIRTKVGERYDRETRQSYSVMVKADDGNGGTDTIAVTINLTNVNEPPATPARPSVFSGGATSVNIMWNPPANAGRPPITDYDLQYRRGTTGSWMNGPQGVVGTTETISGLTENSRYEVRVRATNSDGDSEWSLPGAGGTNPRGNNAPEFSGMSTARSFAETMGSATVQTAGNVGAAVTATDQDGDSLTYRLEGTDAGKFSIVSGSGQIRTKVGERYDRETRQSYSVMVKADDGNGGTDTIAVTINLTNVNEPPSTPARPSVFSGSATSLNVMWNPPTNAGRPPITDYDLQYRRGTTGSWMNGPQGVVGTTETISGLNEDSRYEVRVRARNSDGDSAWSLPGAGGANTRGNNAPKFSGMSTARSFTETVGSATVQTAGNVGAAVTATDQDGDSLTYRLEGTDAGKFSIVPGSGQIRTKVGERYDRETRQSYSVMVKADDGNGGTDTIAVTINLTNVNEPPGAPSAPSVSSSGAVNLNVMWNAPANTGRPPITDYDLQYRRGMIGDWMNGPQGVVGTTETISGLTENSRYEVRVRATNSEGDSPWSHSGSNTVAPPPPPVMRVGQVSTDNDLSDFVEEAAGRIQASKTFESTLRLLEEFRDDEGEWNNGSMYLVLLTGRGGVYFHANDRDVEDLDWSGLLFCRGGQSVLDIQRGCSIEYDGASGGYAHPFSASHVPLAHGQEEFVLLGGFDEIPEREPLAAEIGGPSTEAGEVDTDGELREFVEDAGRTLGKAVEDPDIDPAALRGILRSEGPWREGDVHVYITDETGIVIFDGADRNREQNDEYAKPYVRDIIQNADEEVVGYTTEDGLPRRGYAVRVEVPLDEGGEQIYIVGSGYQAEEQSEGTGGVGGGSGGGCAVGANGSAGTFGLFFVAFTLLFAVLLKRHLPERS